jgi:2-amino-4-hydroxy-6-hydroxymethyldihydropteridine diphosphokinase
MSASAFVALGTNVPFNGVSGAALLAQAASALEAAGLPILARSGVWQTEAWPHGSGQPDYFNAVVELDPHGLSPQLLYETLRAIETRFGRERRERWAARTLDLDLIALGDLAGTFGDVELPHPRMQERAFVLAPLVEIAPGWRHPLLAQTVPELAASLPPGDRYRRLGALG